MVSQRLGTYRNTWCPFSSWRKKSGTFLRCCAPWTFSLLLLPTCHVITSRHINVAQLVGVTRGYYGLNGIVVNMGKSALVVPGYLMVAVPNLFVLDGVDIDQCRTTSCTGAFYANCVSKHPSAGHHGH